MGHIFLSSISTGKTYCYSRRGLGLINYTSECRMRTECQGCVHTQIARHRKFIILRVDTQQAPGSRKWPGVCPPEVVLGAEKEIPTAITVTMCVLQAGGRTQGPRDVDAAFVAPCHLPKRILPIPGPTPGFLSLGTNR